MAALFLSDILPLLAILYCISLWVKASRPNENKLAKKIINKFDIFLNGIYFLIISKDSKGLGPKKNPDPDLVKDSPSTTKRLIFIRHGESDWNDVFNKGLNLSMFGRLFKAIYRELMLLHTNDSGHQYISKFNLIKLIILLIICMHSVY